MSMPTGDNESDPDREAGKQADAMKDQLRKDVASWSAARNATSSRDAAEATVTAPAQPAAAQAGAARAAPRVKRLKPVAADVTKPAAAARKPFRMSYDGVTEADYISYIIERGA